jgi:archaellum component FlaC
MIYEISDCTLCNKQVLYNLEDELNQAKINMTKLSKIIDNQGDQIEMLKKELKYIVLNH